MREGTILAILIETQEPDNGGKEDDRRLHEEVTLLLHPRLVEVKHDGIGRLVGIRYIRHEVRVNRITAVTPARVIEVNHIELGPNLITIHVIHQVIISNHRQVRVLVIVTVERISLFYLLLDEVVDDGIRLTATRSTKYNSGTEGIDHVNPALLPLLFVVETGGQIDGILVLHQTGFLHKRFVLVVKHIIHKVVLKQTAHPQATHQQTDIAEGQRQDIQGCAELKG